MTAAEKARVYLGEGRLVVRELDEYGGTVAADCRGDGAIYHLGLDGSGWFCSCPARGRCAHLLALGSVVALRPRETTP
jgi:hypothetical protein